MTMVMALKEQRREGIAEDTAEALSAAILNLKTGNAILPRFDIKESPIKSRLPMPGTFLCISDSHAYRLAALSIRHAAPCLTM